ncbi:hypothetical protein QFC21_007196 [Naganishia friedmannii]|uniref:Uncharacterized protein n=1 Tax=Naganishia friedmannii TaxID=89922 RepID=A0ACC2UYE2_9TREE|nr:hypothetical protein QFC21_007196 [Naganishia friedmannii]
MSTVSSKRRYSLRASDVTPSDPPIDQLILWACSVKADRLQELSDWVKGGQLTPGFERGPPSYKLQFDWRDVSSVDDQFETVNIAMERCFGTRATEGWDIWVTGSQLSLLAKDFRTEYMKLEEAGCKEIAILDKWASDILDKLQQLENKEIVCPDIEQPNDSLVASAASIGRPRRGSSPGARMLGVVTNTQASEHLGKRPKSTNAEVVQDLAALPSPQPEVAASKS